MCGIFSLFVLNIFFIVSLFYLRTTPSSTHDKLTGTIGDVRDETGVGCVHSQHPTHWTIALAPQNGMSVSFFWKA